MPSSHRRLVHRHAERLLTGKGRELAPGEARIFSYYAPSLDGGPHNVSISQSISAPAEAGSAKEAPRRPVKLEAPSQSFIVATPRFSLAPGIIDSVYPTPGISVDHTILPHIVFRDPDLPWSRSPSPAHIPEDEDKGNLRSPSTWLALLVFSLDELQLNQSQIKHVFQNMPPDVKHEQSETCTLRTLARHTPLLNGIENLVNTTGFKERDDAKDAAEPTELIMVPGKLFNGLFVAPDGPRDKLDVACYQHMAHVRQVATDGMVNAGVDSDEAIFSAVVSRRTGLIDVDTPSTMIAHLISLSWDDEMPFPKDEDRVAMVSLHSWTYTCLPSKNKANTSDMLANLGDHLTVLRTDDARKDAPPPSKGEEKDLEALIAARQRDGYTLTRHHTVTGEVTAALLRGPLTPVQVPRPLKNSILMLSNFGTDLAILDPRLSLMDITYSSAWQLGKSLAMADGAFCAALARLRNAVQGGGHNAAKPDVHALFDGGGYGTRQRAAGRMADLFRGLNQMNTSPDTRGGDATAVSTNRWSYDDDAHEDEPGVRTQPVDMLSQSTPHIASRLPAQLDAAALRLAMVVQLDTKDEGEDTGVIMYNEHNTPVSPDYALIYSWVLDKVHLGDIPAQYLIPDPAFLPEETLRFFHIDANWVDALIDGALSLANHWGDKPEKDLSRASIKKAINKRLRTADKSLGGWLVQMPRYGFLLRSQLLVQFPDLAIDVKFSDTRSQPIDSEGVKIGTRVTPPANTPAQQPILVQKRIAPDTMYVLFDAAPPDLQRITFTVPPHQQCFRVGHSLTADSLQFILRKNYTTKERPPDQKRGEGLGNRVFNFDGTPTAVFSWQTRTLDPTAFGQYLVDELSAGMKGYFDGQEPTSAVLALQLNEDILQLDIGDESFVPLIARSRVTPGFNHRQDEDSPTRGAVLLAEYRQLPKNLAPPSPARGPLVTSPLGFSLKIYPVRGATREFVSSTTGLLVDLIFSLTRPIKGWPKRLTRIFVADNNPEVDTPLLTQGADPAPAC